MKHYQTVDPLQKEPQVRRGLFGIRLLILHFKFQFSRSIKSSTFHIFLNLTYPLRKNLSFPKHLKINQKFTQNCQIVDNVISIGIWRRLKRDRDIGRKAVLGDVKTAFTFTPALTGRKAALGLSSRVIFVLYPVFIYRAVTFKMATKRTERSSSTNTREYWGSMNSISFDRYSSIESD